MTTLVSGYTAERLPWRLSVAVCVLLTAAGQAGRSGVLEDVPADALLAFLLFAQFRILDDLADRSVDAHAHPERVLVRAISVWPIAAAALVLGVATLTLLLVRNAAFDTIGSYLLLATFMSAFYCVRQGRSLLGDHVLLTKYPVLVWIIAVAGADGSPRSWPSSAFAEVALSMLAAFLATCLYEALHDAASPSAAQPALVACEGLLMAFTLFALALGVRP